MARLSPQKINEEKGIPNVGIHSADSEVNAIDKLDNAAATSFAWWKDYHVNGVRPCPDAPGGRCVTIPQSPTLKYCISVVQKPGITFPAAYTPNNGYTSYAQTGITSPNAFPWFAPITPAIVRQKLSNYAFIGPEDGRYVPVDGTDIDQMMKYETPNSARWLVLAEVQAYPMGDIQQCTEWSWTVRSAHTIEASTLVRQVECEQSLLCTRPARGCFCSRAAAWPTLCNVAIRARSAFGKMTFATETSRPPPP